MEKNSDYKNNLIKTLADLLEQQDVVKKEMNSLQAKVAEKRKEWDMLEEAIKPLYEIYKTKYKKEDSNTQEKPKDPASMEARVENLKTLLKEIGGQASYSVLFEKMVERGWWDSTKTPQSLYVFAKKHSDVFNFLGKGIFKLVEQ